MIKVCYETAIVLKFKIQSREISSIASGICFLKQNFIPYLVAVCSFGTLLGRFLKIFVCTQILKSHALNSRVLQEQN